jgi:pimeloyl-ACP methyl ester carboxylesterase
MAFRASHHPRSVQHAGYTWSFIDSGNGRDPLLWLVGGLRVADAAFAAIPRMEDAYRVIAPDYAPVGTMAALADGLAAVLDAAGVERAAVMGGSFGGMLAQVFVRRHPDRVSRLVLSTTAAPNQADADRNSDALAPLADMDQALVRLGAQERLLQLMAPPAADAPFWRAYLAELYTERLDKAHLISTLQCIVSYMEHCRFDADDLIDWPGSVLIIDSDDDDTFAGDRADMKMLYPTARTYTFQGAGHSPASQQPDRFFALVRSFLGQTARP